LRAGPLALLALLALARPGLVAGEDRTELIPGAKGSRELLYRNEVLAEERRYDEGGALVEERIFDPSGLPAEIRRYVREAGRLAKVEDTDGSGNPSGSMTYRYDRNGRLLGVTAEGSLGSGSAGLIASSALPAGAWVSEGGEKPVTTVLGYDDSGRVSLIQTMKGGSSLTLESRSYGEGGLLSSVKTEDKASGLVSELSYDDKGRLSLRVDSPAKGPQAKTEYVYDEKDRVVEERSSRAGHSGKKTYAYTEAGALSRTETRRDGELLLAVDYTGDGRVEEIYDRGVVFVKATYVGGRKVKDEFYAEGKLVRTRDY
jgi:YD repeat-containing protein